MRRPRTRNTPRPSGATAALLASGALFVALALAVPGTAAGRSFSTPTYSSPIALSSDRRLLGAVKLRGSRCSRSRNFHFQPRGLAVTRDSKKLYVTAFFAAVRPSGRQDDDDGKRGLVCRLNINTKSRKIRSYRPAARIALAS